MIRQWRTGMVLAAAVLFVAGCVSTGTYETMETAKNKEIAALQQEKAQVEQQKADLEKSITEQKNQISEQKSQMETMEKEKASLAAANKENKEQYNALVMGLSKEVEKGQLQVRQYKNMLAVDLAEQIFFDSGRATLKSGGKEVLKKVGETLKGYNDKIIRVVGHTDNVPVAKSLQSTFPSNWELSVARATNVVRYLQEVGVPPERMIPAGRSQYDPVASNDTPEGRQKNRRIEIMLLDKNLVTEMTRTPM